MMESKFNNEDVTNFKEADVTSTDYKIKNDSDSVRLLLPINQDVVG